MHKNNHNLVINIGTLSQLNDGAACSAPSDDTKRLSWAKQKPALYATNAELTYANGKDNASSLQCVNSPIVKIRTYLWKNLCARLREQKIHSYQGYAGAVHGVSKIYPISI